MATATNRLIHAPVLAAAARAVLAAALALCLSAAIGLLPHKAWANTFARQNGQEVLTNQNWILELVMDKVSWTGNTPQVGSTAVKGGHFATLPGATAQRKADYPETPAGYQEYMFVADSGEGAEFSLRYAHGAVLVDIGANGATRIPVDVEVRTVFIDEVAAPPALSSDSDAARERMAASKGKPFMVFRNILGDTWTVSGSRRTDQTFTFYYAGTNDKIPASVVDALWVSRNSMDYGVGFGVANPLDAELTNTAPNINPDAGSVDSRIKSWSHSHAVPGTYLYEVQSNDYLTYLGAPYVVDKDYTGTDRANHWLDYNEPRNAWGYNSRYDQQVINSKLFGSAQAGSWSEMGLWRAAAVKASLVNSSVKVRTYVLAKPEFPTNLNWWDSATGDYTPRLDSVSSKAQGYSNVNSVDNYGYDSYRLSFAPLRYTIAEAGQAELDIAKTVDFEHAVGDVATYRITVRNTASDTVAQDVKISDTDLPDGFKIVDGSLKISEVPETVAMDATVHYGPLSSATQESRIEYTNKVSTKAVAGGFQASIAYLPANVPVTVEFKVACPASHNGKEVFNTALATCSNPKSGKESVKATDGLWINSAQLAVEKSANKFEYALGEVATYTVKVTNTAPAGTIAKDVVVSDTGLPDSVKVNASSVKVQGAPASISYNVDGNGGHKDETRQNKVSASGKGNGFQAAIAYLPAGQSATITYTATITDKAANAAGLVNTATAVLDNPVPGAGEVQAKDIVYAPAAKLDVVKRADRFVYRVGDTATYTVDVANVSDGMAKGVTIIDSDLPDRVKVDPSSIKVQGVPASVDYPVDAGGGKLGTQSRASGATVKASGNGFTVQIPYLPASAVAHITYTAVCTKASNGLETMNSATADLENPLPSAGKVTSRDGIWVNNAELSLTKVADAFEYSVGDTITYTLQVENTLEGTIAENVVVQDTSLSAYLKLDPASIKVSGWPGRVDYPVDGEGTHKTERRDTSVVTTTSGNGFTVAADYLPAGAQVSITYQATATQAANGREIVNIATASCDNPLDSSRKSVQAKETVWINSVELEALKRADAFEYRVGDVATYTVSVANTAPSGTIARDVRIDDVDLPKHMRLDPASIKVTGVASTVAYNTDGNGEHAEEQRPNAVDTQPSGNGFTVRIPYLPAGQLATITYSAECSRDSNGLESFNSATATASNPLPGFKGATSRDGVWTNDAVLSLEKEVDEYETQVDDTVHYTVRLVNLASGTVAKDVVLDDSTLPAGLVLQPQSIQVEGVPERILYNIDGDGVTRQEERANAADIDVEGNAFRVSIPYLPSGVQVTVSYDVVPTEEVNGDEVVNTARVRCQNMLDDKGAEDDAVVWVNTPHLLVEKSLKEPRAKYAVGDTVTYQVKVANQAVGTFARSVCIDDTFELPGMQLIRPSVVVFNHEDNTIDGFLVSQKRTSADFSIVTNRNLVCTEGVYGRWEDGSRSDQEHYNPLGEDREQLLWVEFQAVVSDASLAGKTLQNLATATAQSAEPVRDDAGVQIKGGPQTGSYVTTHKLSDPAPNTQVAPGDKIVYTLVTANTGAAIAPFTLVRDYLPTGTQYVQDSASEGGVYVAADAPGNSTGRSYVEWLHRNIASNDSVQASFAVVVEEGAPSIVRNHALTTAIDREVEPGEPSNPEPGQKSNEVHHSTGDMPAPAYIDVVKSSDPAPGIVERGSQISYLLTVTNTGQAEASDIAVYDAIPTHTTHASHEDIFGAVLSADSSYLGWSIPALGPGESVELRFSVALDQDAPGDAFIDNQASWEWGRPGIPDAPLENTTNITRHVVEPQPQPQPEPQSDPDPQADPAPDSEPEPAPGPANPQDPTADNPANPTPEPNNSQDPTEPKEPEEPKDPAEPKEPQDPKDSQDPKEPTDPQKSTDPQDPPAGQDKPDPTSKKDPQVDPDPTPTTGQAPTAGQTSSSSGTSKGVVASLAAKTGYVLSRVGVFALAGALVAIAARIYGSRRMRSEGIARIFERWL